MNIEDMTDEQFDKLIAVEIRRLDLQERELKARELRSKEHNLREEEKQASWEKHAAAIEKHSKVTHEVLARIATALETANKVGS